MTTKEFEKYLRSIGGIENGWRACPNKYSESKYEWLSKLRYHLFYILDFLRIPERKNPFRSRIYSRGFFSIGDGWLDLVRDLIDNLIKQGWDKQLSQCKEKFGGLRFYINGASKECHDLIRIAEEKSYEICEKCGQYGKSNDRGWITTLCNFHRNESRELMLEIERKL